jgi:hypothetical protein
LTAATQVRFLAGTLNQVVPITCVLSSKTARVPRAGPLHTLCLLSRLQPRHPRRPQVHPALQVPQLLRPLAAPSDLPAERLPCFNSPRINCRCASITQSHLLRAMLRATIPRRGEFRHRPRAAPRQRRIRGRTWVQEIRVEQPSGTAAMCTT